MKSKTKTVRDWEQMVEKENNKDIDQKTLKEYLSYDPETGIFTRLIGSGGVMAGEVVGSRHPYAGYLLIQVNHSRHPAHRLAWLYMYGEFPDAEIDHINGVRDDNRIANLRAVTKLENARNRRLQKTNVSGVSGVGWHRAASKWSVRIRVDFKEKWLGTYDDFFEAVCVRKSAENRLGYHPNHGRAAA